MASRLSELWLTTAEEFASAGSQPGGSDSLASYLRLPPSEIERLINIVAEVVPGGVSFAEEAVPVSFGALPVETVASPEDEPQSFAPLPPEIDLHDRMPAVRSQGGRGTCVAHATSAVREFLLGEQSRGADFSEQFIYWACKQRDGFAGAGTWIEKGMAVLEELGACPEATWPYNGNAVTGNEGQGPPPASAEREALAFRVTAVTRLNATWVDSLREVLAAGSPIAFSVRVFDSLQRPHTFRAGDLRLPLPLEASLGGHAMCMVGYVDDPQTPGGGYFIVRNSWGDAFGQEGQIAPGYCRIPYDYLRQHGLEAFTAGA
jgi:C1A family cysteine protease